jgi:lipoate---protein ligase
MIETEVAPADAIMAKDARLLNEMQPDDPPTIHFYEWEGNSVTYGYFVDPFQFLSRDGVAKHYLTLARRPTGGGITFHLTDFAFSILIPASHPKCSLNTLDNYHFINSLVADAIHPLIGAVGFFADDTVSRISEACRSFCMAKPTQYDIMQGNRKVGGAAQRRTRQGFLHQGTISLALPSAEMMEEIILPGSQVFEAMQHCTCPLLGSEVSLAQLQEGRRVIKESLKKNLLNLETAVQDDKVMQGFELESS